jgi:hypothetical protein
MAFLNEEIYGDTVKIQHETLEAFGSGRLVGTNLILTAGHVVLHPKTKASLDEDWEVRRFSERPRDGVPGEWPWRKAKVVWRGEGSLDLAVLELLPEDGKPDAIPRFKTRIGRVTHLEHHPVVAFGFPRGARIDGRRNLFVPYGDLDDEKRTTLAFAIAHAYQPESPNEDWKGFSGSSIVLNDDSDPDLIWIYGAIETVPGAFVRRLDVARLASAWNDPKFRLLWARSHCPDSEPADPLHPSWPDFIEVCLRANKNQVDQLAKTRRYEEAVSVNRSLVEQKIEAFLQTQKPILALVGQSGTGKTFLMAHIAARAAVTEPTLLLLAQKLDFNGAGLMESMFGVLSQESHRMLMLAGALPQRDGVEPRRGDLIVLLDGLNEAPVAPQKIAQWLQMSVAWLKANRVRLIVTSLPETWATVGRDISSDDLYADDLAAKQDSEQPRFVPVSDFNEEEALHAAEMYKLDLGLIEDPAFRHPLTLRMLRDGSSWKESHSIFDLFRDYFRAVFARIRSSSQPAYPDAFCWSMMSGIARSMRSRSSLWIEAEQYYEIFKSSTDLANHFISSHLLVEGTNGLRFIFDELAFSLIASLPISELEPQLRSPSILEDATRDELSGDSLPLILSRLEKEGDHLQVGGILAAIAQSKHGEFTLSSFTAHRIFLRSIRYLRDPALYFELISQFVASCVKVTTTYMEDEHSLFPFLELPGLTTEQRYQLLRLLALRESDDEWRERDWEGLSYAAFWQGRHRDEFAMFVRHELDHNSQRFLEELFRWLQDSTRLKGSNDDHSEARLTELASGVLFFCGEDLTVTVTDRLARDSEKEGHGRLLRLFVKRWPAEMTAAVERWRSFRTSAFHGAIAASALALLGKELPDEVVERLADAVEEVLASSNRLEIRDTCLSALLRVPSRVEGTLERIEQLVQDPDSAFYPNILEAIETTRPARAFGLLQLFAKNNPRRREDAYYVMSTFLIPEDPTRVFKFLLSVPSPQSADTKLGLAFERAFNKLKDIPLGAEAMLSLFSEAYQSLNADARGSMLYCISPYDFGGFDSQLLEFVVQAEDDQDNLHHLLSKVPGCDVPLESMFRLVTTLAIRQTRFPAGIAILMAARKNEKLAEHIASMDTNWSGAMIALSEYRNLSRSCPSKDAVHEVIMSHRSEWP